MVLAMEMQMLPLKNTKFTDHQAYQDAIHALAEDLVDGKRLEDVIDAYVPDVVGYEGCVELDISDEFTRAVCADVELRAKGGFFDFNAVMRDLYRRAVWNSIDTQVERAMERVREDRQFDRQLRGIARYWTERDYAAADAGVPAYGAL